MVTSVAFHPSGTVVASASTDRSIKLFDIRTHKLMQHYGDAHVPNTNSAGGGGVNSISFGGMAGEWLISTGMDGVVKVIKHMCGTRFDKIANSSTDTARYGI